MYRGRFAPTPSGPLHAGSIVAALASWLDARAHGGRWHVRIDDLDLPRVAPGATDAILRTLDALGLGWDGTVVHQSARGAAYAAALEQLRTRGHRVYRCTCTRARIAAAGLPGIDGPRYPGTCRDAEHGSDAAGADRIAVGDATVGFDDALQGRVEQSLATATGDFVLRRADGVFAYHLACVVDDAETTDAGGGGFTHVVRGADLIASTPRQIFVQHALGLPTPAYLHLPVALDARGDKLSKQTRAAPVDVAAPIATLAGALRFLGHGHVVDALGADPDLPVDVWLRAAATRWDRACLPRAAALAWR